jgi:hypothetical protein
MSGTRDFMRSLKLDHSSGNVACQAAASAALNSSMSMRNIRTVAGSHAQEEGCPKAALRVGIVLLSCVQHLLYILKHVPSMHPHLEVAHKCDRVISL